MRRALLALLLASCASTPRGVPTEVRTLLEREQTCHHWAGEEPYDAARRAEIEKGIAESCPGNEEERVRLKKKYADHPEGRAALAPEPEQ